MSGWFQDGWWGPATGGAPAPSGSGGTGWFPRGWWPACWFAAPWWGPATGGAVATTAGVMLAFAGPVWLSLDFPFSGQWGGKSVDIPEIQAGCNVTLTRALTDRVTGLPVDLTGASLIEFEVTPPTAALVRWTAAAAGFPTSGVLTYTMTTTDCVAPGLWSAQAHVVTASGATIRTNPERMRWTVKPNPPGV